MQSMRECDLFAGLSAFCALLGVQGGEKAVLDRS